MNHRSLDELIATLKVPSADQIELGRGTRPVSGTLAAAEAMVKPHLPWARTAHVQLTINDEEWIILQNAGATAQ